MNYPGLPELTRTKILDRDSHACQNCGATGRLQIHHIKPRTDGGDDSDENLITLCKPCHETADHEHKVARIRAARIRYLQDKPARPRRLQMLLAPNEYVILRARADEVGMTVIDFVRSCIGL